MPISEPKTIERPPLFSRTNRRLLAWPAALALAAGLGGCSDTLDELNLCGVLAGTDCTTVAPDPDGDPAATTEAFKEAFLNAGEGDTIVIAEGRYELTSELSILANNVTVKGAGRNATVLDFAGSRGSGAFGIKAESVSGLVLQDLAVVNTAGDAIFLPECRDTVIRDVRVEWERGPDEDNGRYGIYPVRCTGVLVENTVSRGASDAGIYVGESNEIIVRDSNAWENVAGIQIENSFDSEVYNNTATNNTAGLMIFDLPGKISNKNGGRHLVYDNISRDNNTDNFGDPSAIVGILPAGIGAVVIATEDVEFRNNTLINNQSVSIGVVSFFIADQDYDDEVYFPYPQTVYVHDNEIEGGGQSVPVEDDIGLLLSLFFPDGVSDMVYDGIVTDAAPGTPAAITETNPHYICFRNNTADGDDATFAVLNADQIDPSDPSTVDPEIMEFDQEPYDCEGPSQAKVTLDFVAEADARANASGSAAAGGDED